MNIWQKIVKPGQKAFNCASQTVPSTSPLSHNFTRYKEKRDKSSEILKGLTWWLIRLNLRATNEVFYRLSRSLIHSQLIFQSSAAFISCMWTCEAFQKRGGEHSVLLFIRLSDQKWLRAPGIKGNSWDWEVNPPPQPTTHHRRQSSLLGYGGFSSFNSLILGVMKKMRAEGRDTSTKQWALMRKKTT